MGKHFETGFVCIYLASFNLVLRGYDKNVDEGPGQGGNFSRVVSLLNEVDTIQVVQSFYLNIQLDTSPKFHVN